MQYPNFAKGATLRARSARRWLLAGLACLGLAGASLHTRAHEHGAMAEGLSVEDDVDVTDAGLSREKGVITPLKTMGAEHFISTHPNLVRQSLGGGAFATSLEPSYALVAPVDLPAGTIITRIDFYVIDDSLAQNISVSLNHIDPSMGAAGPGGLTASSSGQSASVQIVSLEFSPPRVIDPQMSYRLRFEPRVTGQSHLLLAAKVYGASPEGFSDGFEAAKSLLAKLGLQSVDAAPRAQNDE